MKLFSVIKVYDVYVAAESAEEASMTIIKAIRNSDPETLLAPNEATVNEARNERDVHERWRDLKPFVGDDVSDADFETLKGKTTIQILDMLHPKQPKAKVEKAK